MFGMHLSNSSYAKVRQLLVHNQFALILHYLLTTSAQALDSARLRVLWRAFPAWGVSGGVIALGGRFAVCSDTARLTVSATHYHFIREIPLFARYEVRISIASWDDKWVCFIIVAH